MSDLKVPEALKKASETVEQATKVTEVLAETVQPWQSKTLWVSLIMALAPVIPPLGAVIAANPELAGIAAGVLVAGLRLISSKKVTLKKG
jgi:hypothetical protein